MYQNVLTVAPLILAGLTFLLIITVGAKEWRVSVHFLTLSLCISILNIGLFEEALIIIVIESVAETLYLIFRKYLIV